MHWESNYLMARSTRHGFSEWRHFLSTVVQVERETPDVDWLENNRKAKSVIVRCIVNNQLALLHDFENARDTWKALKDVYEPQSLAIRNYLRRQLIRLQYNDSDALKLFINEFKSISNEYASAEGVHNNKNKISYARALSSSNHSALINRRSQLELSKNSPVARGEAPKTIIRKITRDQYRHGRQSKKSGHKMDECWKKKKADLNSL